VCVIRIYTNFGSRQHTFETGMVIELGSIVRLHGLTGAPQLNGREGFIAGSLDPASGRFAVRLFDLRVNDLEVTLNQETAAVMKLVKPANLEELVSSTALLVSAASSLLFHARTSLHA
jgi:hypothetical protein